MKKANLTLSKVLGRFALSAFLMSAFLMSATSFARENTSAKCVTINSNQLGNYASGDAGKASEVKTGTAVDAGRTSDSKTNDN